MRTSRAVGLHVQHRPAPAVEQRRQSAPGERGSSHRPADGLQPGGVAELVAPLGSAPLASSASTSAALPARAASISGVAPTGVRWSTPCASHGAQDVLEVLRRVGLQVALPHCGHAAAQRSSCRCFHSGSCRRPSAAADSAVPAEVALGRQAACRAGSWRRASRSHPGLLAMPQRVVEQRLPQLAARVGAGPAPSAPGLR